LPPLPILLIAEIIRSIRTKTDLLSETPAAFDKSGYSEVER